MRRYSFVHPLFLSFFKSDLYRDVARNWKGYGAAYLLSLVALCAIPLVLAARSDISDFLSREAPAYVSQLPVIKLSKGSVSIDRPEPYYILNEKTKTPAAIIDTTGTIKSLSGSPAQVLLTKTELIVRKDSSGTKSFSLSGLNDVSVDKAFAYDFIDELEDWLPVFLYPFAVFFSFVLRAIEVLVLSLMGFALSRRLAAGLDFAALTRLSAVSVTPGAICGIILSLADIQASYWPVLSFVISSAYIFYGVKVNSPEIS